MMNRTIESIAAEHFSIMPVSDELEQFSKHLVRYCAQICRTVGGDQVSNASRDYQVGREMGTEVCYNMIRKHFGIE